jgi:hypothetical protein
MAEARSLAAAFAELEDPRVERTKKRLLPDLLLAALCGVVAGAESWDRVAEFAETKLEWLRQFAAFAEGAASADTFERVFARLDRKAFAKCAAAWLAEAGGGAAAGHVAVDGKAVRGAAGRTFSGCLHLVSAWAVDKRLNLGQEAVADRSNEKAAIPPLLATLALRWRCAAPS